MAAMDTRPEAGAMLELAQALLDECDTATAAWNAAGSVRAHNAAFAALLGRAGDDLRGSRLQDLLGEAEAGKLLPEDAAAPTPGSSVLSVELATDQGYGLRASVRSAAVSADEPHFTGAFRAVATPGLERVQEVLDSAVFAVDGRGRVTYWSHGADSLYGVASPEALGRLLADVLPDHPLSSAPPPLSAEPTAPRQTVLRRAGHPDLVINHTSAPLVGLDGTVEGVLDMATGAPTGRAEPFPADGTMEAIDQARDQVAIVDRQMRLTMANPAYLHYTRRRPERVVGRTAAEIAGEEAFATALRPRLEACLAGAETHFEVTHYYPELGRRHLLISYLPVREASGEVTGVAAVVRDTTSQHALAQQRDTAVRLLSVISGAVTLKELADGTLELLAEFTECDTVGMRLWRGGDYCRASRTVPPAGATSGGRKDCAPIVRAPLSVLCSLLPGADTAPEPAGRHPNGRPAFHAGNLAEWASSATSTTAETLLQECIAAGYRTLALVPLAAGSDLLGVIYLVDKRPGLLGQDKVQFLEQLAVSLAVGLEHLNAEKDLRRSEERYRSFVHEFSGIAYRGNLDFVPEFFHGAVEAITGYAEADFLAGAPRWDQVIHRDDLESVLASAAELIAEPGTSTERTYRIVRRDGTVRWVREYITSVADPRTGLTGRVQGTIHDVTESVEAGREIARLAADLAQEGDVLGTLMENTQAQLAYLDANLNFVLVNSAYEAGSGHAQADLAGRYHFDVFPNAENRAIFERVRDTGMPAFYRAKPFEFADDPSRGISYWDWRLTPVKDEQGTVTGLVLSLLDVTELVQGRQQVEEMARKAHRHAVQLEATVDAIADGLIVYGPSGEIVSINEVAREILRYTDEQLRLPLAERARELEPIVEDDPGWPAEEAAPARALRGETVRSQSVSIRRRDGSGRAWLSLSAAPIRDTGGGILGAVMTMSDITPLREAQAGLLRANEDLLARAAELLEQQNRLESLARELEAGRARLHAIIESAPEGIMVVDDQARVVLANPAATRIYSDLTLTGASHQSLPRLLRPDGTAYTSEDRPVVVAAREGRTLRGVPAYVVSPDGSRRDLLINSAPIVGADGRGVGAVSVLQDVTELRKHERQRQELLERVQLSEERTRHANEQLRQEVADRIAAERQVRESRLLLERTFSALRDAIFVVDVDDVIIQCNAAAEEQFGFRQEELLGQSMRMLHVDEASWHRLLLEREASTYRAGIVDLDQFPMRRRDGSSFLTERVEEPLVDEAGSVLGRVCSVRDITERLKLERMKAEFVASVSHELRSPLAAIMGYTEIVLSGDVGPLSELQEEFLRTVQESSQRLEWLINDLLDVSRMETGRYTLELRPVEPGLLLQQAVDNARPQAAEHMVSLTLDLPDYLPTVEADGRRLRQVIDNLVSNALKFTPEGGHVVVGASMGPEELVIEVRDDGIGIPADERQRVFERFYRAGNVNTEDAKGTGLGLYIVRGIVEAHGGMIELESTVGEGSTFRVHLPARASVGHSRVATES